MDLSVKEMRELYGGLTQKDPSFRDAIGQLSEPPQDMEVFSDLDRAKNRLNLAMLGVHPINQWEVELSGIVDHKDEKLYLYGGDEDIVYDFEDLDPKYIEFIKDSIDVGDIDTGTTPISSLALELGNVLNKDGIEVPDISGVKTETRLPKDLGSSPRELLEKAFTNSMVMMTHLHGEINKRGLSKVFGTNKDHMLQHAAKDSFNNSFERSVDELTEIAEGVVRDYGM